VTAGREISDSAGRAGEAALRRINNPSINHKIYGERFVKARVLACFLSGALPELRQFGIAASVET
jgi:hypothetical protein